MLDGLVKAGRKVDGFNLGVGNYNTLQELSLFRDVGVPLKPDIIVLAYFLNDAEPMPDYSDTGWLDPAFGRPGWSRSYRIDTLLRQFGEAARLEAATTAMLYEPNAPGWLADAEGARRVRRGGAATLGARADRLQHPRAARAEALSFRRHHRQGARRRREGTACPSSTCCRRSRTSSPRACG